MQVTMPTLYFAVRSGADVLAGEEEAIRLLARAGDDGVDFALDRETDMSVFPNVMIGDRPDYKEWTAHLYQVAREAGISCSVAHAADCSGCMDPEKNQIIFNQIVRGMEIAAMMEARAIVVHSYGDMGNFLDHREDYMQRNLTFFQNLLPYAKEYNIRIALENSPDKRSNDPNERYKPGFCSTAEMFCETIDRLGSEWFTACVDVGHAAMCGIEPASLIRGLGKERLFMLHIHDNDGTSDQHTIPYTESVNFKEMIKALGDIQFDGVLDMEVMHPFYSMPSKLMPSLAKHVCDIGRYMQTQILGQ